MSTLLNNTKSKINCYHCGDICENNDIKSAEKYFCCNGCKSVFNIINKSELCDYYDLSKHPGTKKAAISRSDFYAFLDDKSIEAKLVQFSNEELKQIVFYLPQMHCNSCIWILENIGKIDEGVLESRVNFVRKELLVTYDVTKTTLRNLVEHLDSIGYAPHLNLTNIGSEKATKYDKNQLYKIGVAGFCFANIMMMSLPHYFQFGGSIEPSLQLFFTWASLLLSIPVLVYAAKDFFKAAWSAIKGGYFNVDFPISLALIITFLRSIYEIFIGNGNGYLDSMSGIVFFMLVGRWVQSISYQNISFDRDYKSFFPIAVNVINSGIIKPTEVEKIKVNDVIQIHSNEILPVDSILSKGNAYIDYSFVNGESNYKQVNKGDIIYAGGRQMNGLIELVVCKEVSQSYLTSLWNNPIFHEDKRLENQTDVLSKYFTLVVLVIGSLAGMYWYGRGELQTMWNAITTVLIVACPCALLLASNYTNGSILNVFAQNKFYLRSANVIEKLWYIDHIVFDKTGTLTENKNAVVKYFGNPLEENVMINLADIFSQSSHPASRLIAKYLNIKTKHFIKDFVETPGKGIEAWVDDLYYKVGSSNFVNSGSQSSTEGTEVYIKIEQEIIGKFVIFHEYREGIVDLIKDVKNEYGISVLSGDTSLDKTQVKKIINADCVILFNQSPLEKMEYIKKLQEENHLKVMMVGDGLNDSGALKMANVGISVANESNCFTPSCDVIIEGNNLVKLAALLRFAKTGRKIVLFIFAYSVLYNVVGLYYAVQGLLMPVIAAILMPLSSISIVILSYFLVQIMSKQLTKI